MLIETFPVGPLQCNCSIVACPDTKEAVVIDPGGDAPLILKRLNEGGYTVKYLLHTHAHIDHIGATAEIKNATGAQILLHPEDLFLYQNIRMQAQLLGLQVQETLPVDTDAEDEMRIQFGQCASVVLHTPGHTPGSVCFHIEDKESHLFSGDTLFQGGIGRTDLWGGSYPQIMDSIRQRLLPLDDETIIYPGHGLKSTVWQEKKSNPFLS